ncbi:hypothetical protein KFU94_44620 [Chloroflexi bacterium TSY]|nr:hypothetical protein [Chloroflexi bacterium TSY]
MIQIPVDIPDATVWRDLHHNTWTIEEQGQTYTLSEWDWGQRHRLIRTAAASGQFDYTVFIQELFEVLLDPIPTINQDRYAFLCLNLLDVPEHAPPMSLVRAEIVLAQAFGWRPLDLADHPASLLDDMIHALVAQDIDRQLVHRRVPEDDGWTSIVAIPESRHSESEPEIVREQAATTDAQIYIRLQSMLDSVATWAGLSPDLTHPKLNESREQRFAAGASSGAQWSAENRAENPVAMSESSSLEREPNLAFKGDNRVTAQEQFIENNVPLHPNDGLNRFGGTVRLKTRDASSNSYQSRSAEGHRPFVSTTPNQASVDSKSQSAGWRKGFVTGQPHDLAYSHGASQASQGSLSSLPPQDDEAQSTVFARAWEELEQSSTQATFWSNPTSYSQDRKSDWQPPAPPSTQQHSGAVHTGETGSSTSRPDWISPPSNITRMAANTTLKTECETNRGQGESQAEAQPAPSATAWGDGEQQTIQSALWLQPTSHTRPQESGWKPLVSPLPRQHPGGTVNPDLSGSSASYADWNPPPETTKMPANTVQETGLEAMPHDLAKPDPRFAQPFALSELEENLADVFERAARETGIDLP